MPPCFFCFAVNLNLAWTYYFTGILISPSVIHNYELNIQIRDISFNKLQTINPSEKQHFIRVDLDARPIFYFRGNPFLCDCNLEWLQTINNKEIQSIYCQLLFSNENVFVTPAGLEKPSTAIPMDATEVYLPGNRFEIVGSQSFIGQKNLEVLYLNNSNTIGIDILDDSTSGILDTCYYISSKLFCSFKILYDLSHLLIPVILSSLIRHVQNVKKPECGDIQWQGYFLSLCLFFLCLLQTITWQAFQVRNFQNMMNVKMNLIMRIFSKYLKVSQVMTEDNVLKRKITDCDNLIKKTSDKMQHLDFCKSQVEFYTNILYWILNTRGALLLPISCAQSLSSHIRTLWLPILLLSVLHLISMM